MKLCRRLIRDHCLEHGCDPDRLKEFRVVTNVIVAQDTSPDKRLN